MLELGGLGLIVWTVAAMSFGVVLGGTISFVVSFLMLKEARKHFFPPAPVVVRPPTEFARTDPAALRRTRTPQPKVKTEQALPMPSDEYPEMDDRTELHHYDEMPPSDETRWEKR